MSIKISALPVATSVALTDVIPIVQSTTTRQSTVLIMLTGALATLPTTLPGTTGVLWNNGGVISVS